jgi:hypothetical protein
MFDNSLGTSDLAEFGEWAALSGIGLNHFTLWLMVHGNRCCCLGRCSFVVEAPY